MSRILVIDDDSQLCQMVQDVLEHKGYKVSIALDDKEALKCLKSQVIDLILLDVSLSQSELQGRDILEHCTNKLPLLPVIMISGTESIKDYLRRGAKDFIEKPFTAARLLHSIETCLQRAEEQRLLNCISVERIDITAKSPEMQVLMGKLNACMHIKPYITLAGGKGSGKTTLARYIHNHTAKKLTRFYQIDISTLSSAADVNRTLIGTANNGLLFEAVGGTLVLENIDKANLNVQTELLRIVNELDSTRMKFKIISTLAPVTGYPTIINALFAKLAGTMLNIPELKQRKADLVEIIYSFTRPYRPSISQQLLNVLSTHPWQAGIHELKLVVEHMLLLDKTNFDIGNVNWKIGGMEYPELVVLPYKAAVRHFTKLYFRALLQISDGNQKLAARRAGVDRSTLHRQLHREASYEPIADVFQDACG